MLCGWVLFGGSSRSINNLQLDRAAFVAALLGELDQSDAVQAILGLNSEVVRIVLEDSFTDVIVECKVVALLGFDSADDVHAIYIGVDGSPSFFLFHAVACTARNESGLELVLLHVEVVLDVGTFHTAQRESQDGCLTRKHARSQDNVEVIFILENDGEVVDNARFFQTSLVADGCIQALW